jgi:hypothetical protein
MRKLEYSQFGRQSCGHKIIPLYGPGGIGLGACFDDAYEMNPRMLRESQAYPNIFLFPHLTFHNLPWAVFLTGKQNRAVNGMDLGTILSHGTQMTRLALKTDSSTVVPPKKRSWTPQITELACNTGRLRVLLVSLHIWNSCHSQFPSPPWEELTKSLTCFKDAEYCSTIIIGPQPNHRP